MNEKELPLDSNMCNKEMNEKIAKMEAEVENNPIIRKALAHYVYLFAYETSLHLNVMFEIMMEHMILRSTDDSDSNIVKHYLRYIIDILNDGDISHLNLIDDYLALGEKLELIKVKRRE